MSLKLKFQLIFTSNETISMANRLAEFENKHYHEKNWEDFVKTYILVFKKIIKLVLNLAKL